MEDSNDKNFWENTLSLATRIFVGNHILDNGIYPAIYRFVASIRKAKNVHLIFVLVSLSVLMCLLGTRRYFEIKEYHLRISTANPFKTKKLLMKDISRIEVSYLAIRIYTITSPEGELYHMRKWPKKYFVNHIALHPEFSGR